MGRYRNVSILGAAIFLQLVGLAVQIKRRTENHSTRLIRVWTVAAVTPLEKNIVRVQAGVSSVWNNYLYLRGVRQQNRQLQDQIQQLQLEQVRLRQDAEQARRLQALLGFKEQFIDKTIAAQVIGSSGSEQSRIVYLDKGTADGITPDMAVISAQGIVGKVIQVFRHTSQVLLINDQSSGVGTILERSRLQGVLKGKATGELVLDKIMPEEDVQPGDRVLTSGGDQIFPKGLPVGTIAGITRGSDFLTVTIHPAASLNHLEEVLVITKKQEHEPALSAAAPMRTADILAQRLPSVPDKPVQPATGTAVPAKAAQGASQMKPAGTAGTDAQSQTGNPAAPQTKPRALTTGTNMQSQSGNSAAQLAPKPRTQAVSLEGTNSGDSNPNPVVAAKPKIKVPAATSANPAESKPVTPPVVAPKAPSRANASTGKSALGAPASGLITNPAAGQVPAPKKPAATTQQKSVKPVQPSNPPVNTTPTSTPDTGAAPQ